MSGRHRISEVQRQWVEEHAENLADAVPPNMVEGLRYMLETSKRAGLSSEESYASVTEALRAFQKRHKPHAKAWIVLEAGCLWLERERKREQP